MNRLEQRLTELCGCPVAQADDQTLYRALLMLVREKSRDNANFEPAKKTDCLCLLLLRLSPKFFQIIIDFIRTF